MVKLTKRNVDGLRATGRDQVIFDDEIPCFGIRVKPSGAKSWLIQYRNVHGQSKRHTLGRHGVLTPDQARTKAKRLLALVSDGADPASDKRLTKGALTVAGLCGEYLHANEGRIKDSTLTMDRSRIERHVKPLLGSRPVASLTPADMEKFLRDVASGKTATKPPTKPDGTDKRLRGGTTTGGSGVASRTLGMLGTILERAVRDGLLQKNPARGIARPKDQSKAPPFAFETVVELGQAMRDLQAQGENPVGLTAIRFLLTTGCRRMEALKLKWGTIDEKACCLRFEDTKSGRQMRPVARSVLAFLKGIKPEGAKPDAYVFPGASKAGHFVGLPKVWARVAKRAGIEDVSLHGLRHWFASAAAEMNYSELTIAGLLGHTVKGVTARYANAPDAALLTAADNVAQRLENALDDKPASGSKPKRAKAA
jgi:integrase